MRGGYVSYVRQSATVGALAVCAFFFIRPVTVAAAKTSPVPTIAEIVVDFRTVFGRPPTVAEQEYWKSRRNDKPSNIALRGAMAAAKAQGKTIASPVVKTPQDLVKAFPQIFSEVFSRPPSKDEKTWWTKRITCTNLKSAPSLTRTLQFYKSKGVTKATTSVDALCGTTSTSSSSSVGGVNNQLGVSGSSRGPIIDVGIQNFKSEVHITANGSYIARMSDGSKKTLGKEDIVKVVYKNGKYLVTGPEGYKDTSEGPPHFVPQSGSIMELANYIDKGASGTNYNLFRGALLVRKADANSTLWAINELSTEDYVKGLGETTDNAPEAFMKALAIAARTYVLRHHVDGGRQPANGFDVTNTANDQIYRGYAYEQKMPDFASKAASTRGQVVTYDGKIIAAVYFSGSDGHTRSAQEVWHSSKFPYLQSKPDPYGGRKLLGHGTGMSAQGAVGFAWKENWDHKKILTYYYTGVKIERGY